MLEDYLKSEKIVFYHNVIIVETIQQAANVVMARQAAVKTILPSESFEQVAQILASTTSKQSEKELHEFLSRQLPKVSCLVFANRFVELKFAGDTPLEQLPTNSTDQLFNKKMAALRLLQALQFEPAEKQELRGPSLPVKLNTNGLIALKHAAQCLQLPEKDILKMLLFKRVDPTQRVLSPYSLEDCRNNVKEAAQELQECLWLQMPTMSRGKKWQLLMERSNKPIKYQQPRSHLLAFLLGRLIPTESQESERLLTTWVPRRMRTRTLCDSEAFQKINQGGRGRFQWFCQQYIKSWALKKQSNRGIKHRFLSSLYRQMECSKCLRGIVEEVVTAEECRNRELEAVSTLAVYIKAVLQRRFYCRKQKELVTKTTLMNYLRVIPICIGLAERRKQSERNMIRVQSIIRCYLTKQRGFNELRQHIAQQSKPKYVSDDFVAKLITTVLNKNNEVKQFESVACVHLRALWVRNIAESPVFHCIAEGLEKLVKDMDKKQERVQSVQLGEACLIVSTDRRQLCCGMLNAGKPVDPSDEKYEWAEIGCRLRSLPVTAKTRNSLYMMSKTHELYQVTTNCMPSDSIPHKLPIPSKIRRLSCANELVVCLTCDNTVYFWNERKSKSPQLWKAPEGIVLDVECSSSQAFALLQTRQIWNILDNELLWKEDSHQLIPFQLCCLRSISLEIMIVKSINFSHTRLSLKDRKDIARQAALRPHPKHDLYRVPFDDSYFRHFLARSVVGPSGLTSHENTDPNALLEPDILELSVSDCSL